MENQQLTQLIRRELPGILRRDREMREWVLSLTRERYADKGETESRFDRVLDELRRDREENTRKWEQNQQELRVLREEQNRKWEEQNRKWDENQATINAMLAEIRGLGRKYDSNIGALGARWGLQTEQSFRNALAGILGTSFGVEVLNVTEYDDAGEVFGRPDQVELDVIIQNGMLILCEIKSSISRSEMHTFARKVAFYEKRHNRKADRALVVSPMVDARARVLAAELGIEVYSYAEDVTL
jgi:hypothetical protein